MSGNTNNGPMLKAASLWSKTSVKGGWYLTGRLGGIKVLVMENRDRQSDDDPSHHLFFVEAPDRRQGGQEQVQDRGDGQRAPAAFRTPQTPSEAHRRSFQAQAPLDHDDAPEWAR
jgi:hypothetical protein